jgi:hypothetical protein
MASIKIKLGILELGCEGPEEFLKTEVPVLLKLVLETHSKIPVQAATTASVTPGTHAPNGNGKAHTGALPGFQSTTENIAVKLGAKSGADLVLAAAARMVFVLGKNTFTRDELNDEIKTATGFYNTNHTKNLTGSLRSLVKDDKLNEVATGNYALSTNSKPEIEVKIRG